MLISIEFREREAAPAFSAVLPGPNRFGLQAYKDVGVREHECGLPVHDFPIVTERPKPVKIISSACGLEALR